MKPNILVLILDGFRADKCYGKTKTSLTPNLDSLLNKGIYFTQVISSSDATFTCVGSIFSANYPSKSGLTTFSNHSKARLFFDFLQKSDYNTYATVPDVSFWQTLTSNFTAKDLYPKPYVYLYGGTGNQILERLNDLKEPWVYYIHIMDLHRSVNFAMPESFRDEKYGNTDYERMVSAIDLWLGKFLEKLDLQKTLVIFTSDHGDLIPTQKVGHEINYIPILIDKSRTIKRITPKFIQPTSFKVFLFLRYILTKLRTKRLRRQLSDYEMRTLSIRGHKSMWDMFDEIFRVPLLFCGYGIEKPRIVNDQVRQIDIAPTILELVGLPSMDNVDGRSLVPLIHGNKLDELPAYIENMATDPKKHGNSIGVRTSKYKYYRAYDDPCKRIVLYDLEIDPQEINNIAKNQSDVVQKMENLVIEFLKFESKFTESSSTHETERIREELKKMGYV